MFADNTYCVDQHTMILKAPNNMHNTTTMWYDKFCGRANMDAEIKIETRVKVNNRDKIGRVKNFVPQKTLFLVDFEDGTAQLILRRDQFEVIGE